ncbi:ExeM/NucH family extracellular endonuclease [candidate division KSB1 bacterium]|nr:ExeM/NucH family extracellular endonuclease [candidate division KSB1 bacterium]RQW00825.1 MAG: ExeM/NucH family extracellular endonuclease [candidate division KSB1 bacterium]
MKSWSLFMLCLLFVSVHHVLPQATDVFFSEYIEGSSYNKAIELYNGTGVPVDLSEFTLEFYANGSDSVSNFMSFDAILSDGDVYVIAHPSADSLILVQTDTTNGSVIKFNGDDAIALRKNGILIDIIGEIGVDPGAEWGSDSLSTADNTLRRKSFVCFGSTSFSLETEWEGYDKDTFDGLGSHYADCGSVTITTIHDIQYTTDPGGDSPYDGNADITTEGLVTAVFGDGYFIQEPAGGAWSGLWIADEVNMPALGDLLRLTGTVAETSSLTELNDLTEFLILSVGNTPPSAELLLTGDVGQEQWEGVLVEVQDVSVTNADLGDGHWQVDDGSGPACIGNKGSYSYIPVQNDEMALVRGPVDVNNGTFIQPRWDEDVQKKIALSLVINEIHADPDAEHGDANGDGVVDTADDEFVEIVNASDASVDLSGWTLADATSIRHIFPEGTVIRQNGAIVVFGGGEPMGDFGGAIVCAASTGSLGLNNAGDTLVLSDGLVDQLTLVYDDAGKNQSITRAPDVTGETFMQHSEAPNSNGSLYSPGCYCGGFCFPATLIHDLQGNGATTFFDGTPEVIVEGVVVGDFQASDELGGFFIQEETAQIDGHESTSEGIFIKDNGFGVDVMAGDMVRVTGIVDEFYNRTEIRDVSDIKCVRTVALPDAAVISLPVGTSEAFEAYEGMLVTIQQELTITGHTLLANYGEVELSVDGRLYAPTHCVTPGAEAMAKQQNNDCCRIQLDDGSRIENPYPLPFIDDSNTLRLGATLPSLTGVLDYSFEKYEIHATESVQFTDTNDRTTAPSAIGAVLRAVAFNVNNFFNGDGQGGGFPTTRGAASFDEYIRQRDKLVSAMKALDADLFGLVEVENDGFGEYSALEDLVHALNDSTEPGCYTFVNPGLEKIGDDEITCGIVYKPGLLTPIGQMAILDHSVDPNFDPSNRPSLAQTFQDTSGEYFTFVINHFRSRSTACPGDEDQGDGQGNCNQTRLDAAIALINWLATDPTASQDDDILIMGDFNAYTHEDPLTAFIDSGYVDIIAQNIGESAYSYVYDAQSGTIDHTLVSASLNSQIIDVSIWHINADEPRALGYQSENPPELYDSGPFRSSDHDPVIVDLELKPIAVELALFQANFINNEVILTWKTASEFDIAGFNMLRSDAKDGFYSQINQNLIISLGDSGRGADYTYVDLDGNKLNFYKLESVSRDGQTAHYGPIAVSFVEEVESSGLPDDFALHTSFPNPFNLSTVIRYELPRAEVVKLYIFDIQGRLVRTLLNQKSNPGSFEMIWNGTNDYSESVAAGLYICRMNAGDYVGVRKMLLVK